MKKIFLILFFFLLLNNCSLNKNSEYWSNNITKNEDNEKKLPKKRETKIDITKMSLKEYEIYIDNYTKKSNFPDINK